jgi:hypothetical protein
LQRGGVLRLPALLASCDAESAACAVQAARTDWVESFGGDQFALGGAWYTHVEDGRARHYFRDAARFDKLVARALPALQEQVVTVLAALLGARTRRRAGWCGPAVVVFPPDGPVARAGGSIHVDCEGLEEQDLAQLPPAWSFVCILQLNPCGDARPVGGGLRVWSSRYAGKCAPEPGTTNVDSELVTLAAGDAVVFDSYRLHQIQPFSSNAPRMALTAHAKLLADGSYSVWC